AGKDVQFQPALVVIIDGREKLLRLRGMNNDGDVQLSREVPDGIEVGIVNGEARSVALLVSQAEFLEDLQSDRPVPDGLLEVGERLVLPSRAARPFPVHIREHAETILEG